MRSILIVDDDTTIRELLELILRDAGYSVFTAASAADALSLAGNPGKIDCAVLDLKLAETDGIDLMGQLKEIDPDLEVVILTGFGTVETAVEAMKHGAFDYITKPFDSQEILLTVQRAVRTHALEEEVRNLQQHVNCHYGFQSFVAVNASMKKIIDQAAVFARAEAAVLIEGESGTGKDLLARAIHLNSPRAKKPFTPINCGALPEALFESELFGHIKGAFTGAGTEKKGLLEEADGGTCFLDEVGELPMATQVKLLRVLHDGELRRVGSNTSRKINIRVIAATNRHLADKIKEGTFREDLYYRLNVIPLYIPPLRERLEDIIPLSEHFLAVFTENMQKQITGFSGSVIDHFIEYQWPGNVRELKNVIERAVILCNSGKIEEKHIILFENRQSPQSPRNTSEPIKTLKETEISQIQAALTTCGGNKGKAADLLGIGRNTLWRKIKEYGLD